MTDWTKALCRKVPDPEIFFSFKADDIEMSKVVCSHCPIAQDCLEYALARESGSKDMRAGIYGGADPEQRAKMACRKCQECRERLPHDSGLSRQFCAPCLKQRRKRSDRARLRSKQYKNQCADCDTPCSGVRCRPCSARAANRASAAKSRQMAAA